MTGEEREMYEQVKRERESDAGRSWFNSGKPPQSMTSDNWAITKKCEQNPVRRKGA